MRGIIVLMLLVHIAVSQTVYEIPFSSKGNVIELSVANNSMLKVEGVKVEATEIPEGIRFEEKVIMLTEIKSKEEQVAIFTFSVDKTVAINKEQTLSFAITDQTGQQWRKEIKVKITGDLHKIMCLFRESGNKQLINFVDTMAKSLHRFKPFGVF